MTTMRAVVAYPAAASDAEKIKVLRDGLRRVHLGRPPCPGRRIDVHRTRSSYGIWHLSAAQKRVANECWHNGWSVLEIARYLSVDPSRVDTGS